MLRPKLTIITVCYNSALTIQATIDSVLSQSFKDFEYLIIDGVSNDGTIEIINKYSNLSHIRFVSEPDEGVFDAMNKGISLALGEWIYFMGSDDVFYDYKVLEKIIGNKKFDSEQIIYGNVKFLYSGIMYDGPFTHEKISTKNICHQALFAKKTIFDKIGLFDTKYKTSADYKFNLQWMGGNEKSVYVDETIAIYNEKGMSGQVWDKEFYYDFDKLLIEYNIVSCRSFAALKKMYDSLATSYSYKIAYYLVTPFTWFKSKIISAISK